MKLGNVLDLNKCFYDKDHWSHPDLKEDRLYLVCRGVKSDKRCWMLGEFVQLSNWHFVPNCRVEERYRFGLYNIEITPKQEGWKHIQEVIVQKEVLK